MHQAETKATDFEALKLRLASPEEILSWSHGEVTKPETINYRSAKPEKEGLFSEKIFGPVKDYECACGKYKRVRYKGIVCDKCGVEITRSVVRRERMGHIKLAAPVAHIWFFDNISKMLDKSISEMRNVIYYISYFIYQVDQKEKREHGEDFERSINKELINNYIKLGDSLVLAYSNDLPKAEYVSEINLAYSDLKLSFEKMLLKAHKANEGGNNEFSQMMEIVAEESHEDLKESKTFFKSLQEIYSEALGRLKEEHAEFLKKDFKKKIEGKEVVNREKSHLEYAERLKAIEELRAATHGELAKIKMKAILPNFEFNYLSGRYPFFSADNGAKPIRDFFEKISLKDIEKKLEIELSETTTLVRKKILRRLKLIRSFLKSGARPEWMFLTNLPVLPPDLRPMVPLDGGRYATSDSNDLYRRIIARNNRLKSILKEKAPEVVVKNEKTMIQEAVDALLDNTTRKPRGSAPMQTAQHRPLRSLADILKGKQGRFRQNLLGKRVDYSGRSVIVVGPELKLNECGLPKKMALELFRPFVIRELLSREIVFNPRAANRLIEEASEEVWSILEEVVKDKFVLLNRAPTLHRLGIEAFNPVLIEGLAIRIPPLVCAPFNADFDGDQMAVHLPLSEEAQAEARDLMLSSLGILKPANSDPVMYPKLEIVLGCYWMSMIVEGTKGENQHFNNLEDALIAYEYGQIGLQAKIKVKEPKKVSHKDNVKPEYLETNIGRLIFNDVLPEDFPYVNAPLTGKYFRVLVRKLVDKYGFLKTADILNKIQKLGFEYATQSGISWGMDDIKASPLKDEIILKGRNEANLVESQFQEGLLTEDERYNRLIQIWEHVVSEMSKAIPKSFLPTDTVSICVDSGARGSIGNLTQMAGMKGLVVNPSGQIIELPIISSFKEGLNVLEYFISTHGGRKGLADTALKTAEAGYLTRRLVDVSQDIIVNKDDCGTNNGVTISRNLDNASESKDFRYKIFGRIIAQDVADKKNKVSLKRGDLVTGDLADKIEKSEITSVMVRTPLTCRAHYGVCQQCYGLDLARNRLVQKGEAVGIVAAQAIGEPGTQLTLRTHQSGGVSNAIDITQGLPRVEELFEARSPKGEVPIAKNDGVIKEISEDGDEWVIRVLNDKKNVVKLKKKGARVKKKDLLSESNEEEYRIPKNSKMFDFVKEGSKVEAGSQFSEGSLNLKDILSILGREATQRYIIIEAKKVYDIAGELIHDKHLEVIVRQMFSKARIINPGDSHFLQGEIVSKSRYFEENALLKKKKKKPATAVQIIMGISKVALSSESFLSAASFQETSRVLIGASLEGKVDYLRGLKENVIIGRLIPAGTGYKEEETE